MPRKTIKLPKEADKDKSPPPQGTTSSQRTLEPAQVVNDDVGGNEEEHLDNDLHPSASRKTGGSSGNHLQSKHKIGNVFRLSKQMAKLSRSQSNSKSNSVASMEEAEEEEEVVVEEEEEVEETHVPGPPPQVKDLWKTCVTEVAAEKLEANRILTEWDLPPPSYSKDKGYPLFDYQEPPDIQTCKGKDFLDFYVFPVLLPGLQALLQHARDLRVFQWKFSSFDAVDWVVEYLYNNNPRFPERQVEATKLVDIPFVQEWLKLNPRPLLPKWLLMSRDDAARLIQRNIRGHFVRKRSEVQEVRGFWKEYLKDRGTSFLFRKSRPDLSARKSKGGLHHHHDDAIPTIIQAVVVIQAAVRGFLVRTRNKRIRDMRHRWKVRQHESQMNQDANALAARGSRFFYLDTADLNDDDDEEEEEVIEEEGDTNTTATPITSLPQLFIFSPEKTHSEECVPCHKFREFVDAQPRSPAPSEVGGDASAEEEEEEMMLTDVESEAELPMMQIEEDQ